MVKSPAACQEKMMATQVEEWEEVERLVSCSSQEDWREVKKHLQNLISLLSSTVSRAAARQQVEVRRRRRLRAREVAGVIRAW